MVQNRVGSLAVLLGLTAITAFAAPMPCPVGSTLQSYLFTNFSGGCTVGELTFSDFIFLNDSLFQKPFESSYTKVARPGDITVSQTGVNGEKLGFTSSKFQVGAGDTLHYLFGYTVDPPPDILPGFELGMDAFSPVAPGSATIDAAICTGGYIGVLSFIQDGHLRLPPACLEKEGKSGFNPIPYTLHVEHLGNTFSLNDRVEFEPKTNYAQVWMLVTLDGGPTGGPGSSQMNGFTARAAVPEAGSLAHLGLNLSVLGLALLFFRRN